VYSKEAEMFLKCGQKENTKYTFGLRKEQREEKREIRASAICCSSCGKTCKQGSKFCPACGGKL
jgi:hypothetical protein